jgi:hypothetical protein
MYALSGIWNHDPSVRTSEEIHATDRAATVIGTYKSPVAGNSVRILDVPYPNFCLKTHPDIFCGYHQFFRTHHSRLLSQPFQFINHPIIWRCIWDTEILIKINTNWDKVFNLGHIMFALMGAWLFWNTLYAFKFFDIVVSLRDGLPRNWTWFPEGSHGFSLPHSTKITLWPTQLLCGAYWGNFPRG